MTVADDDDAVEISGVALHFDNLIQQYANARSLRETYDTKVKELKAVEDTAEEALFAAMQAQNIRSLRHPRGTFSLDDKAWAQVADEVAARQWAEEHLVELLTLNRARLSAVVRHALKGEEPIEGGVPSEYGTDLPPGVNVTFSRSITWRRG